MKDDLYSKFIDKLCGKYIKKDKKVFDCGCGDGAHTTIVKRYCDNVIGGDFGNRTKKEYNIAFRKVEVNKYGRKDEFDLVTSFDVIEHVEDDCRYLKELIKITKPGGIIIIGTPNKNRFSNKIKSLIKGEIKYPHKIGYHYESGGDIIHLREYTPSDLENLVKKSKAAKIIKTYCAFLGLYLPKLGSLGLKELDLKILKNYCQHLFIVIKKKAPR